MHPVPLFGVMQDHFKFGGESDSGCAFQGLVVAVFAPLSATTDGQLDHPSSSNHLQLELSTTDRINHHSGAEKLFAALGKGQRGNERKQWRVSCDHPCAHSTPFVVIHKYNFFCSRS